MKTIEIQVQLIGKNLSISAWTKKGMVGSVTFRFVKKGHYLVDMLQVHDKHQGKGIGTALMRAGMRESNIITLNCFPKLLGFYQKLGFKIVREKTFGGVYKGRKGYEMVWKSNNFPVA